MKNICKRGFVGMLALAFFAVASPLAAKETRSEDQLIADLESPKEKVVNEALLRLEKDYPTSTKAIPKMKALLTDNRESVRRKAARVLGVLHAEVSEQDLKNITKMLKGTDQEAMDALKSLRGLKAQSTIPEILPMLQHKTPNVVRDACRTLAVLGKADLVPQIEPLLNAPHPAVRKDAQDAIFTLKNK
jgi:HEAT repeat protein